MTNEQFSEVKSAIEAFKTDAKAELSNLRTQIDMVRGEMLRPDSGRKGGSMDFQMADYITPGRQFTEKADIELARKTGRLRFTLDGLHPRFETKTLIDSAAVGFSTPGILNAERISAIVPLPRRRLTVRDLLRSKPISAGQIDWVVEATYVNAASPQTAEGEVKEESENTFVIKSEKTRTLAHFIPLSRQILDDLPELRRFIDENLLYGLKVIEEYELLFGDGSGEHLHGLCHQATAYAGTYTKASDTILDKLRHVILELEAADRECTAFVMNPKDKHDADLVKTEEGGSNKGSYLVSDPVGGMLQVPTYWGRPVVTTTAMPAGKFLAGNFANGIIGDRMPAIVELSTEHADFWTRNKVAVRCEERISLGVLDSGAGWRYGSF